MEIPICWSLMPTHLGVRGFFSALLILGYSLKDFCGRKTISLCKCEGTFTASTNGPTKTEPLHCSLSSLPFAASELISDHIQ